MKIAAIEKFKKNDRAQLITKISLGSVSFVALLGAAMLLWLRLAHGIPQTLRPEKFLWMLQEHDGSATLATMDITLVAAGAAGIFVCFWINDLQNHENYLENRSRPFLIVNGVVACLPIGAIITLAVAHFMYLPSARLWWHALNADTTSNPAWQISYACVTGLVVLMLPGVVAPQLVVIWDSISETISARRAQHHGECPTD